MEQIITNVFYVVNTFVIIFIGWLKKWFMLALIEKEGGIKMFANLLFVIGIVWLSVMAAMSIAGTMVNSQPWYVGALLVGAACVLIWLFVRHLKASAARNAAHAAAELVLARERAVVLKQISEGSLPVVPSKGIVVRAGEVVHFCAPAALLKNQTVGYAGKSAGVSVRVAKGVTLRTGGMSGHAVKSLVAVARGELAVLNTRIVFGGDVKSFEVPFAKVTHLEHMADGVAVHVGTTSHLVQLADPSQASILHAITERLLAA